MSINEYTIETLVPQEVYTDRQDHIDYFYNAALKAINRRTMSTVLLGQRRMGKTEIFKRVVNRLFYNQSSDQDNLLIPVFYQFSDEYISREEFAIKYVDNFLRWFAAFRLKDRSLLYKPQGALYGRFDYERIERFTDYYGEELSLKAAKYYGAFIHPEMASIISDRCGGNPFYITAVLRQAAKQKKSINNEKDLNKILAIDISSGFIWMELSDQVSRWIERINEYGVTKWILYLAAIEEGNEIDLKRIQNELKIQDSIDISISKIKEIMVKLARGDLIEYSMFGTKFVKINDPILNEFLKVWGEIEVAKFNRLEIEERTIRQFEKQKKQFHEYKGYLAEVYMIQILWNSQNKKLSKDFFHAKNDINIPDRFLYIDQRHRQFMGKNIEVDIYASSGTEIWMAESKWHKTPIGVNVVNHMLKQKEIVLDREGDELSQLTLWLFSYSGVTKDAEQLMKENDILWSSKKELNQLLEFVGLRKLPEFDANTTLSAGDRNVN